MQWYRYSSKPWCQASHNTGTYWIIQMHTSGIALKLISLTFHVSENYWIITDSAHMDKRTHARKYTMSLSDLWQQHVNLSSSRITNVDPQNLCYKYHSFQMFTQHSANGLNWVYEDGEREREICIQLIKAVLLYICAR